MLLIILDIYETKYTSKISHHHYNKNSNGKRTFLSGFDTSGRYSQNLFTNSRNLTGQTNPKYY